MRDRLTEVIAYTECTVNSFAKTLGISQSALAQYLRGGSNNISTNVLISLHKFYPNINIHWLVTGQGNMLLPNPKEQEQKSMKITALLDEVADLIQSLTQR